MVTLNGVPPPPLSSFRTDVTPKTMAAELRPKIRMWWALRLFTCRPYNNHGSTCDLEAIDRPVQSSAQNLTSQQV